MTKFQQETLNQPPTEIAIHYNEDPPASGKSEFFKRMAVHEPGRYLLVVPTQKLLSEHARGQDGIGQRIVDAGLPATAQVITISSTTHTRSVRRAVAEAADLYRDHSHVVVVCTHAALLTTDLSNFLGWTLLIDEVPNIVTCDTWKTSGSLAQFQTNYRLVPVPGNSNWSRVAVKVDAPGTAMIASDDLVGGLAAFHRRALSPAGVYVNLAEWAEMESGKKWSWWSIWEIAELAAFDRIFLVGNAFSRSVSRHLMQERPGDGCRAAFHHFPLPWERRQNAPRRVVIRYFTEHAGSTSFWTKHSDGQRCIEAVAKWIAANTPAESHMFASNKAIEPALTQAQIKGLRLTPCMAGSNEFDHFLHATILFSSKLTQKEETALALFGIDADEVRRSREFETILQFVFRCIIRQPKFDGTCFWNLYDGEQARFLKEYVEEHGLAEVSIEYVDVGIGIGDIVRPKKHAKLVGDAAIARHESRRRSSTERVRVYRERKKAAKVAQGEYRGRGRPKKADTSKARP
jgi:hypothetical protein